MLTFRNLTSMLRKDLGLYTSFLLSKTPFFFFYLGGNNLAEGYSVSSAVRCGWVWILMYVIQAVRPGQLLKPRSVPWFPGLWNRDSENRLPALVWVLGPVKRRCGPRQSTASHSWPCSTSAIQGQEKQMQRNSWPHFPTREWTSASWSSQSGSQPSLSSPSRNKPPVHLRFHW